MCFLNLAVYRCIWKYLFNQTSVYIETANNRMQIVAHRVDELVGAARRKTFVLSRTTTVEANQ